MDIPLRQKGDRIRRLFFSPLAKHLLISMESGDNFYLFEKWKKPRVLSKFRVGADGVLPYKSPS